MNAQEGILAIKSLLGLHFSAPAPEPTPAPETTFAESTLTDGTIIRYEKLEVGSSVEVLSVDGVIPAPDGAHETNDGVIIETKDGKITNITEAVTEPATDDFLNQKFADMERAFADLKKKIESIEAALNATVQENKDKFNALNQASLETLTLVEKFGALPSVEPVVKPVTSKENAKQEYFMKLADAIKKINK